MPIGPLSCSALSRPGQQPPDIGERAVDDVPGLARRPATSAVSGSSRSEIDRAGGDAEDADPVRPAQPVGLLLPLRDGDQRDLLAVAVDDDRQRLVGREHHDALQLGERIDRVAVDADDAIAGLDAGPLGGAVRPSTVSDDGRMCGRPIMREDRREDDDGEDEIRRPGRPPRPRRASRAARSGTARRRSRQRRRGEHLRVGDAGGVVVALEADIAAERDGAELPARAAAVGEAGQLAAEADGEGGDADAAPAGDEEMPHLVHEHDRPSARSAPG